MSFGLELYKDGKTVLSTLDYTGQIAGTIQLQGTSPGCNVDMYGAMTGPFTAFTVPGVPANSGIWYTLVPFNQENYNRSTGYAQIRMQSGSNTTFEYRVYNPDEPTLIMYGYR